MAYVIVEGSGTYSVGAFRFGAGANPCDDEDALDAVRDANLGWVYVQDTREIERPAPAPEPEPEKPDQPFDKFQGRDGKWYFVKPAGEGESTEQSGPFDTEDEVDAEILKVKQEAELIPLVGDVKTGPESGALKKEDVEGSSFPCRVEGCDREFKNRGARTNHERLKHPKTGEAS